MIGPKIQDAVEREITGFTGSRLERFVSDHGSYAIKYVQSEWAKNYESAKPLWISATPALTWGTATYVTPLAFPLSSALYGRIGLVTSFDPTRWRIFDATKHSARDAYVRWARSQPSYPDVLLTVHATYHNHHLRNKFRKDFTIDCVLFHPDQEAEIHTDRAQHVWMAVTDWKTSDTIKDKDIKDKDIEDKEIESAAGPSGRLSQARFTVLIDEDFLLKDKDSLPILVANRQIERVTEKMHKATPNAPAEVSVARSDAGLPKTIAGIYNSGGFLHVFIAP